MTSSDGYMARLRILHHGPPNTADLRKSLRQTSTPEFAVNGTNVPDVAYDVGESYAGLLPITDMKDERDHLYFWFFPTVNEEHKEKKEIVVWLNGGPACSSLLGFLQENGPFLWKPGTRKPVKNPWSWHELTNVVWIEQPVSVGFSKGTSTVKNEDDVARQFMGFWKNFVDTFSLQGYKVYIAAESYGGIYGSFISSHMINANDSKYFDVGGMIIYNGIVFDEMVQSNVIIPSFVEQHHNLLALDDATMRQIRTTSETCGFGAYERKYLTYPPSGPAPIYPPPGQVPPNGTVQADCESLFYFIYTKAVAANPCFSVYNIGDRCPKVHDPLLEEPYFDRQDVKMAINAPLDVKWSRCTRQVFNLSHMDESLPPGNYELPNVIDRTNNVILAHGFMDAVLPLNGLLLGIQNMTWGSLLGFHTRPSDPFYVPLYGFDHGSGKYYGESNPGGSGVVGTSHHERGLTLVVTQLAGHQGPASAPASAFRHLEKLLGRVRNLSSAIPFTLPGLLNVTQMTEPLGKGTVAIPCMERGC
ncbi:hypothetical protein RJ55_06932 [Drechmeria coniospora]|nr:hypothetical protein RJ55_06932 [Drechmeria coniospora]